MLQFFKYHGTGNDFVLFDNRHGRLGPEQVDFYADLCHRRFGIGADGVILLNEHPDFDFEMYYVNSDGRPTSMCGNGGRCVVAFAKHLGIIDREARFLAIDGPHEAVVEQGRVSLKMGLPQGFQALTNGDHWIDTGSPHYVRFVDDAQAPQAYPVVTTGREIRQSDPWTDEGTNVNFVWQRAGGAYVRTYERGVEDETWSCGTGVTAVAEVMARKADLADAQIAIETPGGQLEVHVKEGKAPWLIGPAKFVFSGEIDPHFA